MIDVVASLCLADGARGAGMAEGPVQVALWDGALGRAQSLCPRTAVGVEGRGYLLADVPAFFGEIVGSGVLEGRVRADDDTTVALRFEPLRYQRLISAIPATFAGYGFTTASATRRMGASGGHAWGLAGQVVLPTAIGLYGQSWPVAVDLGVLGASGGDRWDVHGQLGLAGSAAISKGPSLPRLGIPLTLGATWRPGSAFALVVDAQAAFGYTAPLDHVAVAPGLRFAAGTSWGLELAGTVPVAGRERALAAAQLSTAVRF